ncbi:MAG: tRNA adenosine(34) deaminase TadA [Clostridiales bacterium]|nr:tRNA adenosine(34) deaminase TadA [Clostridiales bacterium]
MTKEIEMAVEPKAVQPENSQKKFTESQGLWMKEALAEARMAMEHEDVPIGAIVVRDGQIIGRGHNRRESDHDPSAHAEILALAQAGKTVGNWRLGGAEMYVTMEPCPMCAFAMVLAQVNLVVYAMSDPRMGACGSFLNLAQFPGFSHSVSIRSGLYAEESLQLIQEFFKAQRNSG